MISELKYKRFESATKAESNLFLRLHYGKDRFFGSPINRSWWHLAACTFFVPAKVNTSEWVVVLKGLAIPWFEILWFFQKLVMKVWSFSIVISLNFEIGTNKSTGVTMPSRFFKKEASFTIAHRRKSKIRAGVFNLTLGNHGLKLFSNVFTKMNEELVRNKNVAVS